MKKHRREYTKLPNEPLCPPFMSAPILRVANLTIPHLDPQAEANEGSNAESCANTIDSLRYFSTCSVISYTAIWIAPVMGFKVICVRDHE